MDFNLINGGTRIPPEKRYVIDRLIKHKEAACAHVKEDYIIAVCLVGSQNYNMDTESSDIDTKIIVLPDENDVYLGKRPTSKTYIIDDEQYVVKDVRCFLDELTTGSMDILQTLFSDYVLINPLYENTYWDSIYKRRNEFINYDINRAVLAAYGKSCHFRDKIYESPKNLANFLHCYYYLMDYLTAFNGASVDNVIESDFKYKQCLEPHSEELRRIKESGADIYKEYTPDKLIGFKLALESIKAAAERKEFSNNIVNNNNEHFVNYLKRRIVSQHLCGKVIL